MAVFYRFIRNLEIAIRDKEEYSSDLGKSLQGRGGGGENDHFEVELRSETYHIDLKNICFRTSRVERSVLEFAF